MNHPTETIATLDTSLAPLCRRRYWLTCPSGRREGQRSMWPVAVVMLLEDVKDPLKMLVVQDQQPVEHSDRTVRTNRSATATPTVVTDMVGAPTWSSNRKTARK